MKPILVDSTQCHLWTDALHLRQLAREARNKWDRGTYVRMAVTTVWTALEVAAQDALGVPGIGYRFKEDLDRAINDAGHPQLDWSQGLWQQVKSLQELRKSFVHRYLAVQDLFPDSIISDNAISVARDAINDLYTKCGMQPPSWTGLSESPGWSVASNFGMAAVCVARGGAQLDDPNTTRISVIVDGHEHETTVMPLDQDPAEQIAHILGSVKIPISAIRVHRAGVLVHHYVVNMRGSN
jgi:hypothetical protein